MAEAIQDANEKHVNYKVYWFIWSVLLVLTLAMLLVGRASISRAIIVPLLIVAMSMKAVLIGGYFMHLRFEKLILAFTVVAAIILTAAALVSLIALDAVRILRLSTP